MKTLKSIGAVLAGMLTIIILSVVTDQVLEKSVFSIGGIPLLFALAYRTLYAVLGGFVTAILSPTKPMKHVWILTIIGSVLGMLGAIGNWGKSAEWYPILLVVFSFFAVLAGGKLKKV